MTTGSNCAEYETCERVELLKPFNGDRTLSNLRKIKEVNLQCGDVHQNINMDFAYEMNATYAPGYRYENVAAMIRDRGEMHVRSL